MCTGTSAEYANVSTDHATLNAVPILSHIDMMTG